MYAALVKKYMENLVMVKYEVKTADGKTLEFECHSRFEMAILKTRLKVNNDKETEYTHKEALYILNGDK